MDSFFNIALVLSFLITLGALLRLHQTVRVVNARISILSKLVKQLRVDADDGELETQEAALVKALPGDFRDHKPGIMTPTGSPTTASGDIPRIWARLEALSALSEDLTALRAEHAQMLGAHEMVLAENALLEDRLQDQLEMEDTQTATAEADEADEAPEASEASE